MRKLIIAAFCCTLLAGLSWAQNVKSIGTTGTAGFFEITLYDNGAANGDTGTYNDGAHTQNTTIWKSNFMFNDGTTTWWADGDSPHAAAVTAGTPSNPDAQNFSNTLAFPGNANLGASVAIALTQAAGNVVKLNYTWTFSNSSASPISLRFVWLHDGDNYIVDNYSSDLIAFVDSANNALGAIAQGETNGAGGIDMDASVLLDTTTTPEAMVGLGGGEGPGNWWSDAGNWADSNGATASIGISPLYVNSIRDAADANIDADRNDVLDAGGDAGAAFQWALVVPASGNIQVVHSATYGLDTDVAPNGWTGTASVSDWQLY